MKAFLGIDTSCYTTSLCLVDEAFRIIADERIILSVPGGGRGLQQSNMVYQHMRNLPVLMEKVKPFFDEYEVGAIGATDKPRRQEDSYMPAFLAGLGCARSLAAVLGVPLYTISHQENHLLAVLRSSGCMLAEPFYGLHVSGGTTELVRAVPDEKGFAAVHAGGTKDISAGQFIDRIGVALGFPFPAGVYVDQAARSAPPAVPSRVWEKDGDISFSGPESQGQRRIKGKDGSAGDICRWVLETVWDGLRRMLAHYGDMETLVAAGGVLSNGFLRRSLADYCRKRRISLMLAPDGYSADNSSGAAFWAAWQERNSL